MDQSSRRRAVVLGAFFAAIFFGLIVRLYAIQVVAHQDYLARRDAQTVGRISLDLPEGPILDARGQVVACSSPVESAWANPSAIQDPVAAAKLLAPALGMKEGELLEKLTREAKEFVWLKRRLEPREALAVRNLADDAVFKVGRKTSERKIGLLTEYRREYPHGSLFANGVGFRNADGGGEGLERSLESYLSLQKQSIAVTLDGKRQMVGASKSNLETAEATLTIDLLLQKVVEEELESACAEYHPRWAVAVVMDPRSGAILALANRPTFDPNKPGGSPPESRLNRVVSAPYEPGSTLKPFTAAVALDLGLLRPDTLIDCENGLWRTGPRTLHDHHPYAKITLTDVIKFSSNIGAAKVGTIILGRNRLYDCMKRWGFGERSGVDLPAEDAGLLFPLSKWSIYSDTSVPMGHEISVTPLQLVAAMSAIANGGTLYKPFAVRRVESTDGVVLVDHAPQAVRRVIGEKASREMIEILKSVVTDGTGKKAAIPGIAVAGKTGTSQKIDPVTKKYTHEKYISSFVAFAPADAATLCVAVILDEPKGGAYYGGTVAAPTVGRILQRGLIYAK